MQVVITGANRGIGRELLAQYAAKGATVTGTCRGDPPTDLATLADWQHLDVADPASVAAFGKAMAGRKVDLLICNAGTSHGKGQRIEDGFAADLWQATFDVNVTGVFLGIQALLPGLRAARGKIAIIASRMGSSGVASGGGSYIYRASKAAAINLAANLAIDLRKDGISVGAYHPGWVRTDMGGANADIDTATSARGLIGCFDRLAPDHTGVFENFDGTPLPY